MQALYPPLGCARSRIEQYMHSLVEGFCCSNGVSTVSIQSARRGDGASVSRTPHHILCSDQIASYLVRLRIESYRGVVAASLSAVP